MKGEPLSKASPEVLATGRYSSDYYRDCSSFKEKNSQRYAAKYDTFHGILKRVSDMKLNGSLDSEEPSTESERSAGSRPSKSRPRSGSSSVDDRSNGSAFEDESSESSVSGSDRFPRYEEIPRVSLKRHSLATEAARATVYRDDFPPPTTPSPTDPCLNAPSPADPNLAAKETEYKKKEAWKRRSVEDIDRRWAPDLNDNRTGLCEARLSSDEGRAPEGISEYEKHQLEVFFRGLKTEVFVCGSLANLYSGWQGGDGNWAYRHTGAIVVILDCGETKSRNKRKIQILLAERGTCFPLWRDTIDNLSAYHQSGTAFHTMHLSSDHRQIVGLSFDLPLEAEKLIKRIEEWTSNPENINISVPGSAKKKSKAKKKVVPLPHKKNISNPCLFEHVTSVAACDKSVYVSLRTLIDDENLKTRQNVS